MNVCVERLSAGYGRRTVLREIDVTLRPGCITAMVGMNASGKSTLLRCMAGLLRPVAGRVTINGSCVHGMSPSVRAGMLAYVAQRPTVSASFTVREIVGLGRYALLGPGRDEAVAKAIQQADLTSVADQPYGTLSVGQQQRVSVARACAQLWNRTGVFVLDEPTSAMDLPHAHALMTLLRELSRAGSSVVMAMHDLSLAAHWAADVWMLAGGALVAAGTSCETLTIERLRTVFDVDAAWVTPPTMNRPALVLAPRASDEREPAE